MSEEIVVCQQKEDWVFCIARTNNKGRVMIGQIVDDENVDMMYFDLSPTEMIALGRIMEQIGLELIQENRTARRMMHDDDLLHYG